MRLRSPARATRGSRAGRSRRPSRWRDDRGVATARASRRTRPRVTLGRLARSGTCSWVPEHRRHGRGACSHHPSSGSNVAVTFAVKARATARAHRAVPHRRAKRHGSCRRRLHSAEPRERCLCSDLAIARYAHASSFPFPAPDASYSSRSRAIQQTRTDVQPVGIRQPSRARTDPPSGP